jgi:hypothetical protein
VMHAGQMQRGGSASLRRKYITDQFASSLIGRQASTASGGTAPRHAQRAGAARPGSQPGHRPAGWDRAACQPGSSHQPAGIELLASRDQEAGRLGTAQSWVG